MHKVMAILYKGLPHPKGKMLAWAPNAKQELTRVSMYGQALPFIMSLLKETRRFGDKIEWVCT